MMRCALRLTWASLLLALPGARVPGRAQGGPPDWWEMADRIAAVEILATDYTAAAADGPVYAEARVLKTLKGPHTQVIRFGASAWLGPN